LSHIASGGQLTLAARSGFVLTETSVDAIPTDGQAKDLKFAVLLATEKAQVGPKEFNSGAQSVMAITRQLRMENRTGEFVVSDSGLGSISVKKQPAHKLQKSVRLIEQWQRISCTSPNVLAARRHRLLLERKFMVRVRLMTAMSSNWQKNRERC
jgi:hypothetical protein